MKLEILSTVATSADNEIEIHESPTFALWLPIASIHNPRASLHIAGDVIQSSTVRCSAVQLSTIQYGA